MRLVSCHHFFALVCVRFVCCSRVALSSLSQIEAPLSKYAPAGVPQRSKELEFWSEELRTMAFRVARIVAHNDAVYAPYYRGLLQHLPERR